MERPYKGEKVLGKNVQGKLREETVYGGKIWRDERNCKKKNEIISVKRQVEVNPLRESDVK